MASTFRLSYRNFPTHNALRYPLSSALCYFFKLNFAQQIANSSIYKTLFVNGKPVTAIGTNLPTFFGQSTFGMGGNVCKNIVNITLTHLITAHLFCLLPSAKIFLIWPNWSSKGRMTSPKRMNFWKSSKRPLTPPPHFRKIMLRFSRQNCDKSAYVQYGGTVVYYMIIFPMRCM